MQLKGKGPTSRKSDQAKEDDRAETTLKQL